MLKRLARFVLDTFGYLRWGPYVGAAALIVKEGKVLLMKERWGYTIPGGFVKYNEDPVVGVVRESREETGLNVIVKNRIDVISNRSEYSHAIMFLYECEVVDGETKSSWEGKPEWIEIEKIPENMKYGLTQILKEYFKKKA